MNHKNEWNAKEPKRCPICGISNEPIVTKCECGYNFRYKMISNKNIVNYILKILKTTLTYHLIAFVISVIIFLIHEPSCALSAGFIGLISFTLSEFITFFIFLLKYRKYFAENRARKKLEKRK